MTIEEICADADISKRTFFNYMETKDEAVLGPFPVTLDGERLEHFVDTPSDNLVRSALTEIARRLTEVDGDGDTDPAFRQIIRQRRVNIIANEPSLALISLTRYRELGKYLHDAVVKHFEAHPTDRRCPELTDGEEAATIVAIIREALFLSKARSASYSATHDDLLETWIDSAGLITTFSKGLTW